MDVRRARRGLAIYFTVVIVVSGTEPGGAAAVWVGESGYLVVAILVVVATLIMARGGDGVFAISRSRR